MLDRVHRCRFPRLRKHTLSGHGTSLTPESKDFVPRVERIAVFNLDGTLWVEQPTSAQLVFALQRVKTLAPHHPEWKHEEPFRSILRSNLKSVASGNDTETLKLLAIT
jgi:hypothetical protein